MVWPLISMTIMVEGYNVPVHVFSGKYMSDSFQYKLSECQVGGAMNMKGCVDDNNFSQSLFVVHSILKCIFLTFDTFKMNTDLDVGER